MPTLTLKQRPLPQPLPDLGLPPLLTRILAARKITSNRGLSYSLQDLLPPSDLGGMSAAVALLVTALTERQRILIVGDFDADGATSSALAVAALRAMGAAFVDFLVPNRFEFGYGLTPEIVAVAAKKKPDLLITVDNGVSSIEGVAAAQALGIKVLVTDHHLPGVQLPTAEAMVNPNLHGETFASKNLAGVGVAFYLMMALRAELRSQNWFVEQNILEPNLASYLDLVALGTVADLVTLDQNNRILVQQGLQRIRSGVCRPGIAALIEVSGRTAGRFVSSDFAFALGPRINAAGRIDDMSVGINCLLSDDHEEALALAQQLDGLNRERRSIEAEMQGEAEGVLESLKNLGRKELPSGLCLFQPHWHQGVIGIVAGRVKDQLHRPVIVFAAQEEGSEVIKGSARSIPDLHIRDVLASVASAHPKLILTFGGHAMAAGLSLLEKNLALFRQAFTEQVEIALAGRMPDREILTDGVLQAEDFNLERAEQLRNLMPWGQGFEVPLFEGRFELLEQRRVGDKHWKMQLQAEGSFILVDAILFNYEAELPLKEDIWLDLVYQLDVNFFRGKKSLQLLIEAVV
ncbi:MAG: single-stranded-DNA-specific exonuclease RecJ [Gammaproteobacteria bacterium]|nr:single-stranded-DNA-specific exonuclease RecJ [Gammaproteobacteria bacterium]